MAADDIHESLPRADAAPRSTARTDRDEGTPTTDGTADRASDGRGREESLAFQEAYSPRLDGPGDPLRDEETPPAAGPDDTAEPATAGAEEGSGALTGRNILVIGESMAKVKEAAARFGGEFYHAYENPDGLAEGSEELQTARLTHNAAFVQDRVDRGYLVVDVGPSDDPKRIADAKHENDSAGPGEPQVGTYPEPNSNAYSMELEIVKDAPKISPYRDMREGNPDWEPWEFTPDKTDLTYGKD